MLRPTLAVALLFAIAGAWVGCGDGDDAGQGGGENETVTVRVGVLPIEGVEPLYIAIRKGYFEEEGIRVEPQLAQGGAAIIPAVMAGEMQFGFSNNVSLLLAAEEGLPVRVLTNGTDAPVPSQKDNIGFSVVVAKQDSGINDARDLEGRSIAVNTLKNIGPVLINASLEKRRVDPEAVEYTEVPFPDMLAALDRGSIDAAWLVEPFSTLARDQGANVLLQPYVEGTPGGSIATYFTSGSYADENPDIVTGFRQALARATRFTAQHPREARRTLLSYTEIPKDVTKRMVLSVFTPTVEEEDFVHLADLMQQYGLLAEKPNVSELLSLSQ